MLGSDVYYNSDFESCSEHGGLSCSEHGDLDWVCFEQSPHHRLYRHRLDELGWLVKGVSLGGREHLRGISFVPDPHGVWLLNKSFEVEG